MKKEKVKIEKITDITGYYWLIKDENNNEIMSYCREINQNGKNRQGGYTYSELLEEIKTHKEWEIEN